MTLVQVVRDDGVTRLGFDRPDKRNALDLAMVDELHRVLDAATEPGILVFHSTTPGMFVAGADIAELRDRRADDALRRINGALFDRIAEYRWPTIAVVDGAALGGGCELAIACDFRIASQRATFAQPELGLGIMAAAGGNFRLPSLVGTAVARRMLLAGAVLTAEEALGNGLVDTVAEVEEIDSAVQTLVDAIRRASWDALELTKRALALNSPETAAFDAAGQAVLFESEEKRRRMDDFLARRKKRRTTS